MVKINLGLGLLVLVLVIGVTVVGCDDDSTNNSANDPSLNGTWVGEGGILELKFNNGYFEQTVNGILRTKATYTTSGNNLNLQVTEMMFYGSINDNEYATPLYNKNQKNEYLAFMENMYRETGLVSEEGIAQLLADSPERFEAMFLPQTVPYSISGTTLTTIGTELTKKN